VQEARPAPTANDASRALRDQTLTQFVTDFVHACSKGPETEAAYYAEQGVDYFDYFCDRDYILSDISDYDGKYPVRSAELASGLDIHWLNDHMAIVNFELAYEVSRPFEHHKDVVHRSICVHTIRKQIIAIADHPFIKP
jgi:hypothetical protein